MFNTKIAIDLGTCNSLVYVRGKGVVLSEPSVVAVSLSDNRILAVGEAAKEMIGRTPADIKVYRPLKDGVIADYKVTQAMMKHFISKPRPVLKCLSRSWLFLCQPVLLQQKDAR